MKALVDSHPLDLNYRVMFGNWLLQNGKKKEALQKYRDVHHLLHTVSWRRSSVAFYAQTGKGVREVVLEKGLLTAEQLDDILSVENLMNPTYKAKLNK